MLQSETPRVYPSGDVAIQFARIEPGGLQHLLWGILQQRVYRSLIHDVKELKERLLREWRLLDHPSYRQRLRNGVIVWNRHGNQYR